MDVAVDTYSEREIDVFASELLSELGPRAYSYAAVTIVLMKDRGDIEGMRVWRRIHGAIARLSLCSPGRVRCKATFVAT